MKKVGLLLISLIMLVFAGSVSAASANASLTGTKTVNAGSEFSVTLYLSSADSVWGYQGKLNYDKTKIQHVGTTEVNGFKATIGSNIVLMTNSPIKSGNVVTLRFKALTGFVPGESTTISLSNALVAVGDGTTEVSANSTSLTVRVALPKSTNNNLSGLTVDGASVPSFNANTLTYNLGTVEKNTINIGATLADQKAKVTGTGTKTLKFGKNTFQIKVTSESGAVKTYTIVITKKDTREANNFLKSLTVKDQDLSFNKNTLSYTINVGKDVSSITINAASESTKAKVSGTGIKQLKTGANSFNIVVTAENGTTKTYQVVVVKAGDGKLSSDTSIKTFTVGGKDLTLKDEINTYLITVANEIAKLDLNIVLNDTKGTVTTTDTNLQVGSNTVKVTIMAEDGSKKEYILYVVRRDELKYLNVDSTFTDNKYHFLVGDKEPNALVISSIKKTDEEITIERLDESGNSVQIIKIVGNKVPYDLTELIKIVSNSNLSQIFKNNYQAFDIKYGDGANYSIYVGNMDGNSETIYLYQYDESNTTIIGVRELKVENGYVNFDMDKAGSYVLSYEQVKVSKNFNLNIDFKIVIIVIETLIIIGGGIMMGNKIKTLKENQKTTRKTKKVK